MAVHQNHDYSHMPDGLPPHIFPGEEAIRNEKLAGGLWHCYGIEEASHKLLATGLRLNWAGHFRHKFLWRRVKQGKERFFWRVMDLTRAPRHALGLHTGNMKRFKALVTGQR
jgi:hypothetical protein